MNKETYQLKVVFFVVWTLITAISFFFGFGIFFALGYALEDFIPKLTNTVFGLGIGAVVGYSQWLYLRTQIQVKSFWGLASVIGLGIPYIITAVLYEFGVNGAGLDQAAPDSGSGTPQWAYPAIIATGGFLIGLLQLSLLKPYFTKAGFWPAATLIAWGACSALVFLSKPTHFLFKLFASSILLGVITGIGLVFIANSQYQGEHSHFADNR